MTTMMETVVLDPATTPARSSDHFAVRHQPSGRFLCWDDTLTDRIGLAVRFTSHLAADRRIGAIEEAVRREYEVAIFRYQPVATAGA